MLTKRRVRRKIKDKQERRATSSRNCEAEKKREIPERGRKTTLVKHKARNQKDYQTRAATRG